jgi:hypothetical protein
MQEVLKAHPVLGLNPYAGARWKCQGPLQRLVVFLLLQQLTCLHGHLSVSLSLDFSHPHCGNKEEVTLSVHG